MAIISFVMFIISTNLNEKISDILPFSKRPKLPGSLFSDHRNKIES